ncbi:LD-carboxypeptidase [Streptomyces sp. NPDC000594]|uniref:S66 peptidase family protein n=1 Tax=Streptomyces sp. NPDC000594 TaxID=3154261 RepID=UPI00333352AF
MTTAGLTPLTRPRRLRPGARVAVVAPCGPVPEDRLEAGLAILRSWELEPVVAPHVLDRHGQFGYLAAYDGDRARDLTEAWCDPTVEAVLCARGGYGAQRMVDRVDWSSIRAAGPKIFVGYSDVTALHEAFAARLGLVTLHGPMVASLDFLKDDTSREHLRSTLFAPESVLTIGLETARPLIPGQARGITFGGCASLLAADLGTPAARRTGEGGLLLLEDVGEDDYRLDRILTQLLRGGFFDGVTGIALGSWADCGPYERIREVLRDRLGGLCVPVVEELGFGHGGRNLTLPLGVPALLNADAGTVTLDGPALS